MYKERILGENQITLFRMSSADLDDKGEEISKDYKEKLRGRT